MTPDIDRVADVIRETAAEVILPRFRRLDDADVSEKRPGDVVTIADLESERRLSRALRDMVPGSLCVGEEGSEADPALLDALHDGATAWIIDPVDGTQNFVDGVEVFAVIVAFARDGRTCAGWIHDPVRSILAATEIGGGARLDGRPVRLPPPPAFEAMSGSVAHRAKRRIERLREQGVGPLPRRLLRNRCTGRDYLDLLTGRLDFSQYRKLKPWDHAAGVLLHSEAGGYSALVDGRRPYRPRRLPEDTLLTAPDPDTWDRLNALLNEG